jgi:hypothetical protein
MAAKTGTYTLIASNTLGSAQAQVTFSNIGGSYTDLVLVINGAVTSGSDTARVRLNGSSSSIYSQTNLAGNGSVAGSSRNSSQTSFRLGETYSGLTTARWTVLLNIMDYSNTTTNKTMLMRTSDTSGEVATNVGLFQSTSAITSIDIYARIDLANTFVAGSTFKLYGIEAGNL